MRALAIILWHRMIFVVFISIILCLGTSLRGQKLSQSALHGSIAQRLSQTAAFFVAITFCGAAAFTNCFLRCHDKVPRRSGIQQSALNSDVETISMQGQSGSQQSALNSDIETISVRGHSGIQESDLDSGAEAISVQGHSRG